VVVVVMLVVGESEGLKENAKVEERGNKRGYEKTTGRSGGGDRGTVLRVVLPSSVAFWPCGAQQRVSSSSSSSSRSRSRSSSRRRRRRRKGRRRRKRT